nr:hypothetical protein [Tanacetum cinerariifolium]
MEVFNSVLSNVLVQRGLPGTNSVVPWPRLSSALPQAVEEEKDEEDEVPVAPTPPSPIHALSLPQAQPAPPSSPPQERPTDTFDSSMTLLNTLMETWEKIAEIDVDKDITLVDMETEVDLGAEVRGRKDDNAATKEVNAAEPTLFDDEKMQEKHLDNIRKYESLKRKPISVAQTRKNMIVYLKNMAGYKMEHFKDMTYDKVRPIFKREYNKVQTLFKPDKDVAKPTKKKVAEETLLHESFKKLKAVEVSGSEST